jgi:hypothetical protein
MINGTKLHFKLAQYSEHAKNIVHLKTKTISLVTTISCTAGNVTLAATSNESCDRIQSYLNSRWERVSK